MNHRNSTEDNGTSALTPRQEQGILALLACASVEEAARSARIGRTTLYRWLKDEAFLAAYQAARHQGKVWALSRLRHLAGKAVHTLERILDDPEAPAPVRVSAAKAVLELALHGRDPHPEHTYLDAVGTVLRPGELSLTPEPHQDYAALKEGDAQRN